MSRSSTILSLLAGTAILVSGLIYLPHKSSDKKSIAIKECFTTQEVLEMARPFLPDDPVIFEAGAFNGLDTVKMAEFYENATIYAFEPTPENIVLIKDATQALKNVRPHQLALSNKTGLARFFVSGTEHKPEEPVGACSLLPPNHDQLDLFGPITFPKDIYINTITIDEFAKLEGISRIDFMWLDMQGTELDALEVSELASKARVIWSEVEWIEAYEGQRLYSDVKNWLQENDFEIIAADFDENLISEYKKNRSRFFGNILFVKKEMLN